MQREEERWCYSSSRRAQIRSCAEYEQDKLKIPLHYRRLASCRFVRVCGGREKGGGGFRGCAPV